MSLLLVGLEPGLGEPLVAHLIAQDDEVRVIEANPGRAAHWKELGAYVARGEAADADLMERAAQNVRTIVVFERAQEDLDRAVETALEGASLAGVGRIVVCAAEVPGSVIEQLRAAGIDYVALSTGRRRRLFTGRTTPESAVTAAVDAADDLAGPLHLELDLSRSDAWDALGLG
jgi:D-arabinose 1-dehydrogenase-like Zn-dependent alcohol dehydrogenase